MGYGKKPRKKQMGGANLPSKKNTAGTGQAAARGMGRMVEPAKGRKAKRAARKAIKGVKKAVNSFIEPNKELTFGGGVKMMQSAGARRRQEQQEETTRNSPNNPGGRAGTPVGTYAGAKAKDPKLDSYIKKRKQYPKGSKEYNYYQNKINKAYGKGPTNRPEREPFAENRDPATGRPRGTGRPAQTPGGTRRGPDVKPIEKKEAKPIPNERPTPTLKQPLKPKAPEAPEGKKPKDRRVKFQSGKEKREARRASNKAGRMADRMERKEGRIRKALGRSAKRIQKLSEMKKKANMGAGGGYGKMMSYTAGGKKKNAKGSFPDLTGDGKVTRADVLKGRGVFKSGGKKKGGGMSGLSAAQKEVYRRGLAAYMSSGNRPKTSQHAWAMARVKSDFGKREAAKIRAGKSGKGKKKK
jgi:hypothetical protein